MSHLDQTKVEIDEKMSWFCHLYEYLMYLKSM